MNDDEEPLCNISGECESFPGAVDICNCQYCGKELHERDGDWWTWDAELLDNPMPQRRGVS